MISASGMRPPVEYEISERMTSFAAGEVGQAFSFNANGDAIVVADNPTQDTGGEITLDAWIFPSSSLENSSNAHGSIINKRTAENSRGYTFEIDNENTTNGLRFEIQTSTDSFGLLVPNATKPDVWQHVAAVYDGLNMTIYVNGVAVGSTGATGTINAVSNPLVIGQNIVNGESFPGLIDEVELFSCTLSPGEILGLYNAGSVGKCKPACVAPPDNMISWWNADAGAHDIWGGNDGTLQGGADFISGLVGLAFNFNGTSADVAIPDSPSWNFGAGDFTFDFWARSSSNSRMCALSFEPNNSFKGKDLDYYFNDKSEF